METYVTYQRLKAVFDFEGGQKFPSGCAAGTHKGNIVETYVIVKVKLPYGAPVEGDEFRLNKYGN